MPSKHAGPMIEATIRRQPMKKQTVMALALAAFAVTAGVAVGAAIGQTKLDPDLAHYKAVSGVSGNVSSVGSDTLNNLMTHWAESFSKFYPNAKVQIEGKGSSTAPPALISGTAGGRPRNEHRGDGRLHGRVEDRTPHAGLTSARGGAACAAGRPRLLAARAQVHRASAHARVTLRTVILQLQRAVAVVVDERRVLVHVARAPDGEGAHHHPEVAPAGRQGVGGPGRMLGIELAGDDAVLLEDLEALRQHVGGDAVERRQEILKAPRARQEVPDHEEGPALAEELERLGHRTRLPVALGHGPSIVLDRNASH